MLYADEKPKKPVQISLTEPGEDKELKAMAWTWSVLCELNQVQRDRVVDWLDARNNAARQEPEHR